MTDKTEILGYLKTIKPELRQEGIESLGLFGSFARDEANVNSDIDIVVKFENDFLQTKDAWAYFEAIDELKSLISQKFHTGCDVFDIDSRSHIAKTVAIEALYV